MAGLKEFYKKECVPQLMNELNYKNTMQVPKLTKIVLNMGLGEAVQNPKIIDSASRELSYIAGQKAVMRRAKKSIAGFKLRQGMPIGCSVTLRSDRMYDFFSKLIHIALPRVRDFRGVSQKSFDGRGNYALGIKEQIIFPEIDYDKIDKIKGLNIVIATSAQNDQAGRALLRVLGMPFKK
ncbi:MAG: 50S ribosomal protein L5 [Thermodesulfobacteriota bacterium]|nr:50S ribosomal protein L5 [Thermodesulfobacteriota bacterium]